jgi:hypothetical protein
MLNVVKIETNTFDDGETIRYFLINCSEITIHCFYIYTQKSDAAFEHLNKRKNEQKVITKTFHPFSSSLHGLLTVDK